MTLFDDQPEQDVRRALSLVEQTIAALGHDPEESRRDAPAGETRYAISRGSAQLTVAVRRGPDEDLGGSIRVWAKVVRLPVEGRLREFFQRLLELNGSELSGVAFAVVGEDAVLLAERSVRDLDASEVDTMVRVVGREADKYDDELAAAFSTVRSSDQENGGAKTDR